MAVRRSELARLAGFAFVAIAFAVIQPFVLIGLPLALLIVTYGPRGVRSAIIVALAAALAYLGDRSGLWWFERGWSLILAGTFVWVSGWRVRWGFSAQALGALGLAAAIAALIFSARPDAWRELDALMIVRASEATRSATQLLGGAANETVEAAMQRLVGLQVLVFPALLGLSSLGALGVAVGVRRWLVGDLAGAFGRLRSFRFNDHLVWIWLIGLGLLLAPLGQLAGRVGGNAVLFMGALYVVRGLAVALTLSGGISLAAAIVGVVVALLLYPVLALMLVLMLIVGLSDTWLNLRSRIRARGGGARNGSGHF